MTGKVVVITGGSRGLGRAMALGFAEAGADLAIASRKLESCEETAREIEALGQRALPVECHVGGFVTNWSAPVELIRLSWPDECDQLSKSPLPSIDHPARRLDLCPIQPEPPRRRGTHG